MYQLKALVMTLPVLGLLVVTLYLIWAPQAREPEPTHDDWLAAARHVQAEFTDGDVIRIEPTWLTSGRIYFSDLDGGKRRPFRILDLHAPVDKPYLYRFQRLWLVTAVESRGREDEFAPDGAALIDRRVLDRLTVSLYRIPADVIRWSLLESLRDARLERRDKKGNRLSCDYRGESLKCSRDRKYDVGIELRQVAGGPRNCLLIRPDPGGKPAILRFPPTGNEGRLLVRAGNTVEAARSKEGGDVTVTIRLGEEKLGHLLVPKRSYAFETFEAVLGPEQAGRPLVLELTATDEQKRELCMDGYVLAP